VSIPSMSFDGAVVLQPAGLAASYGAATSLIRVDQFASAVRVFPQRKFVCSYVDRLQLWSMNSDAIHTLPPTGTAAP